MLRTQYLQLWWNLSHPAMEEELDEGPLYREFAWVSGRARSPDETTILRFRHLLERKQLTAEILATINGHLAPQGLMLMTGTLVAGPAVLCVALPEVHTAHKVLQRSGIGR